MTSRPPISESSESLGEEGLLSERRGRGSTGRSVTRSLSAEEQLKKAQAKIKYLEAELDLQKS